MARTETIAAVAFRRTSFSALYLCALHGDQYTERMRTNGNFPRGAVVVPAVWFKAHPGAARCQERDVQRVGTSALFPDRGVGGLF